MVPPPGIGLDWKILRLGKALYGLKQAPLAWFEKLSETLAVIAFICLPFDPGVFLSADYKIIVVVYLDDITTAGSRSDITRFIDHLCSRFKFTVKGSHQYILGIEIKHTPEGMELSQQQYINIILPCFGMDNCRPVSTPIDQKTCSVKASDSDPIFEQNLYQRMIRSLMYLVTCTGPDLVFSVSYLSRFSSHALERHHTAVKRVFRYLAGTRFMSLKYNRSASSVPFSIIAFSDSDYASCRDTRRSVSGYAFMLNGCAISWLSKKQQSVASSTTEAEFLALATTSRQAVWYLNAFTQLGYNIPITIMADNASSINVAENLINNPRTKHIDVAYHFTREHLIRKSFTFSYVPSNDNTADFMTKGLNSVAHH